MDEIRSYRREDLDDITALLVDAFHDDPGYEHVFPDRRRDSLRFLMPRMLLMRSTAASMRVCVRENTIVGLLVTLPSSTRFGLAAYVRHGLMGLPLRFGWVPLTRLLGADSEMHALQAVAQPPVHHLYIAQLAVRPDHQGRGVGSALMRDLLDAHGSLSPVSLLTTKSQNVLWYGRFGFQVKGQCGIAQAFTAWCMVRE